MCPLLRALPHFLQTKTLELPEGASTFSTLPKHLSRISCSWRRKATAGPARMQARRRQKRAHQRVRRHVMFHHEEGSLRLQDAKGFLQYPILRFPLELVEGVQTGDCVESAGNEGRRPTSACTRWT
jgi:hypothetical protein